jgi:hypothetical protein
MSPSNPRRFRARGYAALGLWAALVFQVACSSNTDEVCQNVGDCSQGGSNDWINACQAEAKALQSEAATVGCGSAFDAYFSCADSAYTCTGATATFPGCADRQAALDACLTSATAGTSCAALAAAETTCGGSPPDGGATAGTGLPPACTALRACQARCYLDAVAAACAPAVDELEAFSACAGSCLP